jgi:hypothetical protein
MSYRRFVSLSLLLLTLPSAGCIDFEAERARYCSEGGSGCTAGPDGTGGPDAGPDAGPQPEALTLRALTQGSALQRRVGATLSLEVEVTDAAGLPVPGTSVRFSAPVGEGAGGSFAGAAALEVLTDTQGVARAQLTANAVAGAFEVQATAEGAEALGFLVTTVVPVPFSLQLWTADSLETVVGGTLPAVRARVLDQLGEALAGARVTFQLPMLVPQAHWSGGGYAVEQVSDAEGMVESPALVAETKAGTYDVLLSCEGGTASASVSVRNLPGAADRIVFVSGLRKAPVMQDFPPIVYEVRDAYANPVPDHTVRFVTQPAGSSAWGRFGNSDSATATSGSDGRFTLPTLTANSSAGSFLLRVYVNTTDILDRGTESLEQVAGEATQLLLVSGDQQGTLVGTEFAPLVVAVRDAWGNPVRTGQVGFAAPLDLPNSPTAFLGEGSLTSVSVDLAGTTDGVASVTARANATAAGTAYGVVVTYGSLQRVFSLGNDKYALSLQPGWRFELRDGASAVLEVVVRDRQGQPVTGHAVTLLDPVGSYGTFVQNDLPRVSLTTDASGAASAQWVSNSCNLGLYAVEVRLPDPLDPEKYLFAFPARFSLENTSSSSNC